MSRRAFFPFLIILILCFLGSPKSVISQPMPSAQIITTNPCDRTFTLEFPIWRQDDGADDNELGYIDITVNDGSGEVNIFRGDFWDAPSNIPPPSWIGGPWPWTTNVFEPWDDDQYWMEQFLNGWSATKIGGSQENGSVLIPGLTAINPGGDSWVVYTLKFSPVPASWYGKSINVKLSGDYDEGQASINQTLSMNFPSVNAPSGLLANGDCNSILVSWTKPSISPCTDNDYSYQIRYRSLPSGSFGNWLPVPGNGSTTSYSHTGINPGDQFEYEVRSVLAGQVFSNSSDKVQGTASALPPTPNSFVASNNNCNQTVLLTWGFVAGVDNYQIFRDGNLIETLSGTITSYTDMVPARGVNYSYTLQAANSCGISNPAGPINGISPAEPNKPADVNASIVPGVGVQISWPDVNNETGYKVERSQLGGGGASYFNVGQNVTSYLDESLIQCQTYEYRVFAINDCSPLGVLSDSVAKIRLVPDLSTVFEPNTSLLASKGFFPNRVEMNWTVQNNLNFLNGFKIYRKPLGSSQDSTVIGTLNSGSNFFIDAYADAGVMYQYFIIAESQCETTTLYSNVATSIGFRSPFGIVTGNVSYGGGIAVEGVRISAESTAGIYGKSLSFVNGGVLRAEDDPTLEMTGELLVEGWFKPISYLVNNMTLVEKALSYSVKYDMTTDKYQFFVFKNATEKAVLEIPSALLPLNNYSHLAMMVHHDSLKVFINGERVASQDLSTLFPSGVDIYDTTTPLIIGKGFRGYADELRIWNIGKTDEQMKNDFSRLVNGGDFGLKVYLRMDEGIGLFAYDISKSGAVFNRNHAAFLASPEWSDEIPSASQLGAAAYTDSFGNYVLTAPYHGNGEVFTLTPSYLTHEFSPATEALFLGDGSFVHAGIDFLDKSSFKVNGSLIYKETSCGVKDATLKVDGVAVIENGIPVKTDDDGLFEIRVPLGEHVIEVEQEGHVYSVGRFPATGLYNFQEDLAGVNFKDSTLVKIVGRVVGGLREARKIPGLGKSKNNIGQAEIILTSQQGNGCATHTVMTVDTSGEYTAYVQPLKYVPTVSIIGNPAIDFGVLNLLDLSGTPTLKTEYDTLFNSAGDVISVDSVQFHKRLDYVYRVKPEIAVFDKDGSSPFIGDSTYTYFNVITGDTLEVDLRTDPFRWPVFHQQEDDYLYRCMIRVFEKYTNLATGVIDSVPTTDGTLFFNNELSHVPNVQIELSKFNNADTLKSLVYSFQTGTPNFAQNLSIPAYSFTKKFEINLILSSGEAIPWLPIAPANVPFGGDAIYRAYLLGTRSNGQQFVTFGPDVPEYVLRDPPGSGSSATREIGTTKTEKTSWNWKLGAAAHTKDNIYAGAKFNVGLGVSTATEIENNNTFGFKATIGGGNQGSQSVVTTNTQSWATHSETVIAPGANSDLYIGKSKNVQFGVAEELAIIPNDLTSLIETLPGNGAAPGYSFGKKYGLSIIPGGYQTQFITSEYDIKNIKIPDLISLRNALLQSNAKYTSHLPISDANYGKNNDDPVFGNSVSTVTPKTGEFADLTGPSYTYNAADLQDSLAGDSVRIINIQIGLWEEAIALNEWEKVNIDNQNVIDSLKQVELDQLEEDNLPIIAAYATLIAANGIGGAVVTYGLIATPVPGTAIAGYSTFAVTSASNIALNELTEQYQNYLNKKDRILEKFEQLGSPANYTFNGGTSFSNSMTHASASSYTTSFEFTLTAEFVGEVEGKVNNTGVGIEKGLELSYTSGREWESEEASTESVNYTLAANVGDQISVDVYPSMLGWGPIFKTKAGSATSCPHEEAVVTSFYEPGTVISPATLQLEKPTISGSPSILTNIPSGEAAVFNLTLGNESEANYTQGYVLRTISASNPFGAIVRFDGVFSQVVEIPGGTTVNKVMTIQKGPGPVHNYDSILVVLTSQCQYTAGTGFNTDIADSLYVSAHFLPSCSNVTMASPENQWVLNNSFNDTMPVAIVDYNINFEGLDFLRVDYKPSDQPNWIGLQTFLKDTSGMNDPSLTPIPTSTPFTLYDWDVSQLPDGDYDLRILSKCEFADKASTTHSGVIDRINPHAFGNPSPADGVLSPNDEISIQFNEPIYAGSINPTINFDIRGVTNGTEVDHSTSLHFDGVDDYVEVTGGVALQRRDFTIEFSVKRSGTGEEAIISQGTDVNERLFIGFDADDHFVFRINGQEVKSTATFADNIWHYFAVSYDFEGEHAELYVADQNTTATIINNGNTTIYSDYVGGGKLLIGKNSVNNGGFFSGNFHELRIWGTTRTLNQFSVLKSSLLSGTELGLLYNWRFDEATGNLAEEHIRRRDATIVGPTWEISPNGHSAAFDGVDDYLKIATGDVNITPGMDFTLEFWFNSSQAGAATLFSNGTGTGLSADSLYSWNIDKDATGRIHVKHYGMDFVATNDNFFDGQWHHFALVFQRSGNLTCFLDGNQQNTTQSLPYKQFGGSHMYLGVRGFSMNFVETLENHFAGQLDEFRFWNTARKVFQVKRDKQNRMNADELGLELYLPFESYHKDPTGIPILTPTFDEQIDATKHSVSNPNGTMLSNSTPTIKLQRPVQAIAFTYSINNDKIILTPTTSQEIIENVTLDVTVKGLKDLHGNVMESPVTWIAFVDRNQVVWQDDLLEFSMIQGENLSFNSGILNQGGAAKVFEILDGPSWLTVTPQSGTINPNSAQGISFKVDPNVPIGDYTNDLSLLTDFNFPERLTIQLKVRKQAPDWAVNPANFEHSMGIIGSLKINNVVSTDEEDMLAAFVGQELRGVARLEYIQQLDAYLAFMDVYSNAAAGEILEFRVWDASSGTVFSDVVPDNIVFSSNTLLGTTSAPQIFETGNRISMDISLNAGWNWLGFPLEPDNRNDLDGILTPFAHTNGDQIKGQSQFSNFDSGAGQWIGSLNAAGIQSEQLYKLNTALSGTLTMKGAIIDPTTKPINLVAGWNWIGFISIRNQPIEQALGNLTANAGDLIKGKTQFATYDPLLGWIGSLKTLKPGQGFLYQSSAANTFTYPLAGMFGNFASDPENGLLKIVGSDSDEVVSENWKIRDEDFNTNMTLLSTVSGDCLELLTPGKYGIGLFDQQNNPRALAPLEMVGSQPISYLTIAGKNGDLLRIQLLDLENGSALDLNQPMVFETNSHSGDLDWPFTIEVSDDICIQLKPDEEEVVDGFNVFPTVFVQHFFVDHLSGEKVDNVRLHVMDALGRIVFSQKINLEKGWNRQRIDLPGLASGLYNVELQVNGKVESRKLIKAKE
ncbi:MAG: LamG-like jellyroll fold domain-containing protein [Saprospiraceae bacterium]